MRARSCPAVGQRRAHTVIATCDAVDSHCLTHFHCLPPSLRRPLRRAQDEAAQLRELLAAREAEVLELRARAEQLDRRLLLLLKEAELAPATTWFEAVRHPSQAAAGGRPTTTSAADEPRINIAPGKFSSSVAK